MRRHRRGESFLEFIGGLVVLAALGCGIYWFVSGKNPLPQLASGENPLKSPIEGKWLCMSQELTGTHDEIRLTATDKFTNLTRQDDTTYKGTLVYGEGTKRIPATITFVNDDKIVATADPSGVSFWDRPLYTEWTMTRVK